MSTSYFIALDADDEPTLWRYGRGMTEPVSVARRCENTELWDLAVADRFVLWPQYDRQWVAS